jgi:hypothetical protein
VRPIEWIGFLSSLWGGVLRARRFSHAAFPLAPSEWWALLFLIAVINDTRLVVWPHPKPLPVDLRQLVSIALDVHAVFQLRCRFSLPPLCKEFVINFFFTFFIISPTFFTSMKRTVAPFD